MKLNLQALESELDMVPQSETTVSPEEIKEFLARVMTNETWMRSQGYPPEIVASNTASALSDLTLPVPIPSNDQIAEVLEAAADLFESERLAWVQGVETRMDSFGLKVVAACAIGALNQVRINGQRVRWSYQGLYTATVQAVTDFLNRHISVKREQMSIPIWNDMPGRTVGEVIDLFKAVAKDLRNNNEQ